jgi:dihydroxyacetone kinase
MQKIINDPAKFVDEMLEGILLAHPSDLRLADDPRALVLATAPVPGKIAIATGGGSGHLPTRVGRAGWLADRSQGSDDAGARLIAIVADAASRYVAESSGSRAARKPSDQAPSPWEMLRIASLRFGSESVSSISFSVVRPARRHRAWPGVTPRPTRIGRQPRPRG